MPITTELSRKTKALNNLRQISKIPFIERQLVRRTQGLRTTDFLAKLIPNNYQYAPGTVRKCERGNIEFELDISDYMQYCIYYGLKTEPRENLYSLVVDGTTIIDVGTNIGETLLNFCLRNPRGMNLGFEPVPFLFDRASYNLKLNNIQNVNLQNCALSDEEKVLVFNMTAENNSGGIYLSDFENEMDETRTVNSCRLDHFVSGKDLLPISLIKIDVEGYEYSVLKGAEKTLEEFQPVLFVEINDHFLKRQGSSANELFEFLWEKGYQTFYADTLLEIESNKPIIREHFDIMCKVGP